MKSRLTFLVSFIIVFEFSAGNVPLPPLLLPAPGVDLSHRQPPLVHHCPIHWGLSNNGDEISLLLLTNCKITLSRREGPSICSSSHVGHRRQWAKTEPAMSSPGWSNGSQHPADRKNSSARLLQFISNKKGIDLCGLQKTCVGRIVNAWP